MKVITVEVREDHLENLAQTRPLVALAELIWNALDAEATETRVEFVENELQGIDTIRIIDNGHGLHYEDSFLVFRNLGGSWKRKGKRTHERRRMLHGKYGKGRFRAFSLGNTVSWHSTYKDGSDVYRYHISGDAAKLGEFSVHNQRGKPQDTSSGMTVEIGQVSDGAGVLRGVKAMEDITNLFALYLRQYPDTRIVYDGIPLDPVNAEHRFTRYTLDPMVMEGGERVTAELDVVEWNLPGKRGVVLCDENGFMRINALPRLHFRGFSYTAYLKSEQVAILDREGLLETGELYPDLRQLLDAARAKLREHFTLREAEEAQDVIDFWKESSLYPYASAPRTPAEINEQRIFDIYATHLDRIFTDFSTVSLRTKRLVLRLIQELVHADPVRVASILDELITFPEEAEEKIMALAGIHPEETTTE
ncbi:MAG: ATP-binding protein [Candidatus Hydrogenedentes bacterium]|nr:ATP-binding protein [Candidatus Hydrogenedentota bacterium]